MDMKNGRKAEFLFKFSDLNIHMNKLSRHNARLYLLLRAAHAQLPGPVSGHGLREQDLRQGERA
jgi:hypothetical protein